LKDPTRPLTIFTPSFADEANTNAQNLTVKEIVTRLPPELFRVAMLCGGQPDERIAARKNTRLWPYYKRGNTARLLTGLLGSPPDIYFFPREGLALVSGIVGWRGQSPQIAGLQLAGSHRPAPSGALYPADFKQHRFVAFQPRSLAAHAPYGQYSAPIRLVL